MAGETVMVRGHARRAERPPARLRRSVKLIAIGAMVAALLSACGGSKDPPSSAFGRKWSAATVVRLAGLRRAPDLSYRIAAHPQCATLVLLLSSAEVETYKGSGDVIVTNPDRSAGVEVTTDSPSCRRLFAQAFARVR